jgi:NitT/TauT family transport system ATP-binding protein
MSQSILIIHAILEAMFLAAHGDDVAAGEIAAVYNVPLPRPRTLDIMANPLLVEITQKIHGHFLGANID